MTFDNFTLLESVVKHAPLGLRFYDLAYSMNVTDGLNVTARPFDTKLPILRAAHSPISGIYGFYTLPGFRLYELDPEAKAEAELSDEDKKKIFRNWEDCKQPYNWIISVEDTLNRFLPQVMPMCLPKKTLFEVPLYSNAARPAMAGYATVRGELWDKTTAQPARWAVVTISHPKDGKIAKFPGVTDGRGMFVVFLPYPKPLNGKLLKDQVWSLTVEVQYSPDVLRWSDQLAPETAFGETVEQAKERIPPDTKGLLLDQTAAEIFDIAAGSNPTLTVNLRYRTDLVLKTRDQEPDSDEYIEKYEKAEHRLWIAPA